MLESLLLAELIRAEQLCMNVNFENVIITIIWSINLQKLVCPVLFLDFQQLRLTLYVPVFRHNIIDKTVQEH